MGPVIKLRFRDGNGNRGFEIIKKNMKKVVTSKKHVVNRRTIYNWKVKLK